ncbi:unnamed protein product [Penicillium pancosmium]
MTVDSYYNGNDVRYSCEMGASDQDSQYAPTPGYFGCTPEPRCGLSPSPGYYTQNGLAELSQRHAENPRLLQLSEWGEEIRNDELPASCIQYMIEWKVMLNRKVIARDTEEDVVLTPSAYWPVTLKPKLEKLLEGKTSRAGRVRSDDTSIVVSVNDRSQRDLTKRFDNLNIDWTAVEKQLLRWGALFCRGKKLRLSITFKYVEDDRHPRTTSGRVEKRGRSSVTKRMLSERDAQLDAEENASGEESIWRGRYCWQDPHGKKHYGLRTHHLKRLIAFVEKGGTLQSHDDVPDNIREDLYMEERHRLESQQSKNNKMTGTPGSYPPINLNFNGVQPSPLAEEPNSIATPAMLPSPNSLSSDDFNIPGLRDEAVREYTAWHEANVGDDNLKAQFREARDIALANGLDLQLIYEDQDPSFFIDKGIVVGIARQFVRDIVKWFRGVRSVSLIEENAQASV